VVGLGNIGASLLRDLRDRGVHVRGVDVDPERVAVLAAEGFDAATSPTGSRGVDVWLVTTSTGPGLIHLRQAVASLPLQAGDLLSVESTVPVGTMETIAAACRLRGLEPGRDLHLVHCPHRVMFGRDRSVLDVPRVIGGVTSACLLRGLAFYRPLVRDLYPVADVRVAELAKLAENALRFVDVAYAEVLASYSAACGIDFRELRRAVNTKDNVHLLDVDYGVGGECLPKDLAFLAELTGSEFLTAAAGADAAYQLDLLARAGRGQRILVRGLGYKPGARDLTGSRAVDLVRRLEEAGRSVWVADPLLQSAELAAAGFRPWEPGVAVDVVVERGRVRPPSAEERGQREGGA
jgi:nucleotide sugar dehydrogenase